MPNIRNFSTKMMCFGQFSLLFQKTPNVRKYFLFLDMFPNIRNIIPPSSRSHNSNMFIFCMTVEIVTRQITFVKCFYLP